MAGPNLNDLPQEAKERVCHYGTLGWRRIHAAPDGTLRGIPPEGTRFTNVPPELPQAVKWQHPKGLGFRGGIIRHILTLDDNAKIPTPADQVRPEPSEAGNQVRPEKTVKCEDRHRSLDHMLHPVSLGQTVDRMVPPIGRRQIEVMDLLERWWRERMADIRAMFRGNDKQIILDTLVKEAVRALDIRDNATKPRYRPFALIAVKNPDGSVDLFDDSKRGLKYHFPPHSKALPSPPQETATVFGVRRDIVWNTLEQTKNEQ